ncbi:MAG: DUF6316 family protein [Pseudomonadales bacterium]|jgi:hypothetical protein|nr:DUF6316 family protein [Gammaproteobacteria bacterium]
MGQRQDDASERHYFRADRLFMTNSEWYFATREGIDRGPYGSRDEALRALAGFIDEMTAIEALRSIRMKKVAIR